MPTYARIVTYQGSPNKVGNLAQAIQERVQSISQEQRPVDSLILIDRQSGKVVTIALWESEEALRASREGGRMRSFIAEIVGATGEPTLDEFEVAVAPGHMERR